MKNSMTKNKPIKSLEQFLSKRASIKKQLALLTTVEETIKKTKTKSRSGLIWTNCHQGPPDLRDFICW
jgi:hypothetical protein